MIESAEDFQRRIEDDRAAIERAAQLSRLIEETLERSECVRREALDELRRIARAH